MRGECGIREEEETTMNNNDPDLFPCDVCGEPIPSGQEVQAAVDGEPCLRHEECEFEQCSACEELIVPGEECYHDCGAGEVGVFCPKCDEFEDECWPQIGPGDRRRDPTA
jgi:hypothetical protein